MPSSSSSRPSHRSTFIVLTVIAGAYMLMQSAVVPALPDFQEATNASATSVGWVLSAFLLTASVSAPIVGRLGDMYGKKRLLMMVLAIVIAGMLTSAMATSLALLIAGSAVQGVGGGIFPLAYAIIRDEFPPERVAGAIGVISSLIGIAGGIGVSVAGPIVQYLNYHWVFWLPLIPLALGAVAAHFLVPESSVRAPGRVNWLAAILLSSGLVMVLVAVGQTTRWGWGSPKTIVLIVAGLLTLVAWVRTEMRADEPLIDMRMMRIRGVWTTNGVAFLYGVGLYTAFVMLPRYVREPVSTGYGFGASIAESGLYLLPATAAIFLIGQLSGRIDRHLGFRVALILGLLSSVGAFVLLVAVRAEPWQCYLASVLLGGGVGFSFSAMANLIVQNVPPGQTGVATGMNTVMRMLGGTVGGQIAATFLAAHVVGGQPTAKGYTVAFAFGLAGVAAGLVLAFLVPRHGRADTTDARQAAIAGNLARQET